ncbi:MAG: DUF2294 domain-containing protein [Leptolyngbyaceae cyanobacterium SM1_1_3]|nr:DUF2294 domain-containing protein [Leptolyngbyaceae cyanobacterium SM1_1_3]NJM85246.1 DUF2294 domain-containing protein [Leptolyngbyaceae cyanobacterium RM2_2_21]NJN01126.1 DUF2294 domain-containing protein [Leptolyngbyaceae cyanobacterium RM1_1_2]NJO10041.1 DUF2294 domain-containing protein [Leptolyngbyaceae cyanobacterium SL_1_1]
MSQSEQTIGQLERDLSQRLQALYRHRLGHRIGKVTCQMFEQKLAIVLEDSLTLPEQLIIEDGCSKLADEVHDQIERLLQPEIKSLIEEIFEVEVVDLLTDAKLETGRTGMIAVLDKIPEVRNPDAIPKVNRKKAVT